MSDSRNRAQMPINRRLFGRHAVATAIAALGLTVAHTNATEVGVLDERIQRSGQHVADYALQYVGYPYVWAANGPWGFDCSGFTQWVIRNTLGIEIGHATGSQTWYGTWVDAGDLQPGDQVFFANTWGAGVSHTGIYIGDHQFIHAENESTGVCVSWLWSDYYAAHYWGAMRNW